MPRRSRSHWYPEYPGDYARKTAHLSLAEHGAYLVLRQHYYSTEKPLPTYVPILYRICRATEEPDRAAVDSVIAQFFTREADGYHNARCDEELAKRHKISDIRRKAVASRPDRKPELAETGNTNVGTNVPRLKPLLVPTSTATDIGSGGGAREADRDAILRAAKVDVTKDATGKWFSSEVAFTIQRWRDLGLSQAEIIAEIESVMRGREKPPSTLAYFNGAMERAAGRKKAPPLQPDISGAADGRRSQQPSRSTEGVEAFLAGASRLPG